MEVLLITVINVAACITLPKLLSLFLSRKSPNCQTSKKDSSLAAAKNELTSFPYCTVYNITGTQYCKFRPRFCDQCSPNS